MKSEICLFSMMCFNPRNLQLFLACFFCLETQLQAGDHYCPNGYELEVDLTARSHQDERLIASTSDGRPVKPCNWRLTVKRLSDPRLLVLQSLSGDNGTLGLEMRYQLHRAESSDEPKCKDDDSSGSLQTVQPGLFQVLTIADSRTYESVSSVATSKKDTKTSAGSPTMLRALTPLPGFCSRDMLSFRGSCYAVSAGRQSLTAAMSSIRGVAQLASFSSMAEISEFIAANNARQATYPYNRPLSLTQAVRFGLFHKTADREVRYLLRTESGCELRPVSNPAKFLTNSIEGPCGSLRLDTSGKAVVDFDNCSEPTLSLISFPEIPASSHKGCKQCIKEVLELVNSGFKGGQTVEDNNLDVKLPLFFVLILAFAIGGAAVVHCRCRNKMQRKETTETLNNVLLLKNQLETERNRKNKQNGPNLKNSLQNLS